MKKLFVSIASDKKIKSLASDKEISIICQSHHNNRIEELKRFVISWDDKKNKPKLIESKV